MTRNKNNKGFTLVELIVVLAILAILAAMLVPSLTGYIDKAKEKEDISNARTVLVAAQSVLSDLWASDYKSVCDTAYGLGSGEYACTVVIPVSNAHPLPDRPYNQIKRYIDTYNLAEDIFGQDYKVYFAVMAKEGVAKEAIYYSPDSKNCLIWTNDNQAWEKVEYYKDIWKEKLYSKCGYPNTNPNWNGSSGTYIPQ